MWAHGSFSFKDLLDIVNPLQHVPIIGSIYRYLTGDEPSGGARVIGESLYGGADRASPRLEGPGLGRAPARRRVRSARRRSGHDRGRGGDAAFECAEYERRRR